MGLLRTASIFTALIIAGLILSFLTGPWTFSALRAVPPPFVVDANKGVTRIVVGSGLDQRKPMPVWAAILASEPEIVVIAGDVVRGDAPSSDPKASRLATAYRTLGRVSELQILRRRVPVLAIWDAYDYGGPGSGRDFVGKGEAQARFDAFWGLKPDSQRAQHPGRYDAVVLGPPGQRVQIILLDERWFRSVPKSGPVGGPRFLPDLDPAQSMLGADQWTWLEGELRKPADIRLVVSPLPVVPDVPGAETWSLLPNERTKLFDLITETGAKGVIFLSGNRRAGAIYRDAAGAPYPVFELTASGLNSAHVAGPGAPEAQRIGPLYEADNFGVVQIDWARQSVALELKSVDGQTVREVSVPIPVLVPTARTVSSVLWPDEPTGSIAPDASPVPETMVDAATPPPIAAVAGAAPPAEDAVAP